MLAFIQAHAKAFTAFATAEAASVLVLLQSGADIEARNLTIALLLPVAVGSATSRVRNNPPS